MGVLNAHRTYVQFLCNDSRLKSFFEVVIFSECSHSLESRGLEDGCSVSAVYVTEQALFRKYSWDGFYSHLQKKQ